MVEHPLSAISLAVPDPAAQMRALVMQASDLANNPHQIHPTPTSIALLPPRTGIWFLDVGDGRAAY